MDLPGSPKAHVWIGLVIALVGVAIGGYAYTGDRVYHAEFILVAFLGFALLVGGSVLTGWGQANRPRMGGKAARRKEEKAKQAKADADQADDGPGIGQRVAGAMAGLTDRVKEMRRSDTIVATVQCPGCGEVFEAEGSPPFEATCPACGHVDQVQGPPDVAGGQGPRTEIRDSPRTRPAPESVDEDALSAQDRSDGRAPGLAARIRDRLPRRAKGPQGAYSLACDACGHVFTAHGQPPFEATCPACGHTGTVEAADA